ncbi:MAG: hypothetical protein HRT47_12825 [Candidatus Caenarcaniphilales bacterium]|nr:hypothetical protein [Candidatus Caenarcaniphilales bacterium]
MKSNYSFEIGKFKAEALRMIAFSMSVPFGTMVLGLFMKRFSLDIVSFEGVIKLIFSLFLLIVGSNLIAKGVNLMNQGADHDI